MKINTDTKLGSAVESPCVRNCCLDENEVCMGCGRHIHEILSWHQASNPQRLEIIANAQARLVQRAARNRNSHS